MRGRAGQKGFNHATGLLGRTLRCWGAPKGRAAPCTISSIISTERFPRRSYFTSGPHPSPFLESLNTIDSGLVKPTRRQPRLVDGGTWSHLLCQQPSCSPGRCFPDPPPLLAAHTRWCMHRVAFQPLKFSHFLQFCEHATGDICSRPLGQG